MRPEQRRLRGREAWRVDRGHGPWPTGSAAAESVAGTSESPMVPDAPAGMPANQAAVWAELAPHAAEARTLTRATMWAFAELCDLIVLKRAALSAISRQGLMLDGTAHPLLAKYTALQVRVENGLTRFQLLPMGKEMPGRPDASGPVDDFGEFDAPLVVLQGGKP